MAEEGYERADEGGGPSRSALWVSAGALAATMALIALIMLITGASRARDEALGWERRTYEVIVMTRTIDAAVARSEAALGRYVLDERQQTGTDYYNEWRNGAYQIGQLRQVLGADAEQTARVTRLQALFSQRGQELAPAASAAQARRGQDGLGLLYQAASSATLPALRALLQDIARAERANLARRTQETQVFAARVDAYTDWLGWLAILIGIGAVGLAILAWRAFLDTMRARREAASAEYRAAELDEAVHARTLELSAANENLQREMAEREAAEAKLRQVQKMEAVGQLTGGIAHDFNNMLAVVVGGLDLARRKLHGPRREVEYHLDNAMEGATRAAALTRRLLSFARAEPLLPEAIAPARLVEEMLELADRALGERITVNTLAPDEEWLVWADRTQLDNAILNLAVNARDAMDGAGELTIAIEHVALRAGAIEALAAGDYVRIAVSDTGRGIAPEHLHRVFEPFFTTKPLGKGTGLGLSQIFGFARQSRGDVTLASTLGEGTTVALYLPRWLDEAATRPAPRPRATHPESIARAARAVRILVVEDDPRVARATSGALEELGHRAVNAASGEEALALLDGPASDVDLVVTDVMMPEMTGAELAAAIRRRGLNVPILFVTGYVGEAGDADNLAEGDLLRKPFTVAALAEAVENTLAGVSGSRRAATGAAA
ncbi:ATP-binding protein [Sphingosinicella sp.]|uniref:ATP-binding protein n=1 Tax=Sphingosinicella sp. TaxID=1917971 RepID=UPI0040378A97